MIDLLDDLAFSEVAIPDSEPAVRVLRLSHDAGTGAGVSVVDFPAGWTRSVLGRYGAGEEFLVLRGSLTISGISLAAGDYAWIPPGALRWESNAPEATRVLAWFSGPGEWIRTDVDAATTSFRRLGTSHLSGQPHVLRCGGPGEAQGCSEIVSGPLVAPAPADAVELDTCRWEFAEVGELRLGPGRYLLRHASTEPLMNNC